MARECSWVTPHLSYQSTHELHLYNLFLLVAKPGSVALVMLTWCRLVRVLRCAEHAHALQVVTHALFKERDVARLSSWGSTLWWCVVPLWAMWGE